MGSERRGQGRPGPGRPGQGRPGPGVDSGPDALAARRATRVIGLQLMGASAILVLGIVVVAIAFVLHQSLPREQIDRLTSGEPRVYVDTGDVFSALVVIGVGAVAFAGVASVVVARRAVRPLTDALHLQRDFVADASHELRTPLAVLDARIQVLERRLRATPPPGVDDTAGIVADLRNDSRALVDIVDDLLLAASGEAQDARANPIEAAPVVREAVESLQILAAGRRVGLRLDLATDARLAIPPAALRRCVVALVDNAVAHSPAESTVTVSLARRGPMVELAVADQGAGIIGIAPQRVFDRFAHAAPASEAGSGAAPASGAAAVPAARPGFGIGLALVREIAVRQGGRVSVAATSPAGTTMLLELPAVP